MKYNPENYDTVKKRKKDFYADHPDGRIIVDFIVSSEVERLALFKATIYLTAEDHEKKIPRSTGYAYEERDLEKRISKKGEEYEPVNYSSWVENCEESAVGRALDNAGYAGNNKCSREEMEKAQRMSEKNDTEKKKEKLLSLPENIQEGFRNIGYGVGTAYTLCEKCKWNESEIMKNINTIADGKSNG